MSGNELVLFNPFNHRGRTLFIFSECWVSQKKSYKKSQYCQMPLQLVVILWKEWSSKLDLGFSPDIWHSFGFSSHLSWGIISDAFGNWKNHRITQVTVCCTYKLPSSRLFRAKTWKVTNSHIKCTQLSLQKDDHSDLSGITLETYIVKI